MATFFNLEPTPSRQQEVYIICLQLNQLKSDLRDVLYSHKWTPDAYLLAKAYIAEDDSREEAGQTDATRLPRLSMKQPSRKL